MRQLWKEACFSHSGGFSPHPWRWWQSPSVPRELELLLDLLTDSQLHECSLICSLVSATSQHFSECTGHGEGILPPGKIQTSLWPKVLLLVLDTGSVRLEQEGVLTSGDLWKASFTLTLTLHSPCHSIQFVAKAPHGTTPTLILDRFRN